MQPDPSVFDPSFVVPLTAAELDYYQNTLGYNTAAINALVNTRTAEYRVLHTRYAAFDDAIVKITGDGLFVGLGAGLHTGDAVTYDANANSAIAGLTDTSTYFVRLQPAALSFDPAGAVSTTKDTIVLATGGLNSGDELIYDAEGHSAIGGLTSGSHYFVSLVGPDTATLYDTPAHAVAGGRSRLVAPSRGSGSDHQRITASTERVAFKPNDTHDD